MLKRSNDFICCVCGKPAVAFWPIISDDIPAFPYCKSCLKKEKAKLLKKYASDDAKTRKKLKNLFKKSK